MVDKKKKVTVFGAGVAGMTAAHELAIRGFAVTVIDPAINPFIHPGTLDRGIGGMARSQFVVDADNEVDEKLVQLRPASEFLVDTTVDFASGEPEPKLVYEVTRAIKELVRTRRLSGFVIIVPVKDPDAPIEADSRFEKVQAWLKEAGVSAEESALIVQRDESTGPAQLKTVRFTTGFPIMPAEHGFRFFPSFYRHIFDTMKRTRILAPRPADGGPTVYDNLVPVEGLGFAREGNRLSFVAGRHPVRSFEELRQNIERVLGELEWTGDDLARFSLKLFEYMTSCSKRREREYENKSWSDFVNLRAYSPTMQNHVEFGPQMMLSLRGSRSDARTQGNAVVQLLLDHIREGTRPDATLGAPTSGAWFDHWHRFLVVQDVKFFKGAVTLDEVGGRVVPRVEGLPKEKYEANYYVLALPIRPMVDLARALSPATRARPEARDLKRIEEFLPPGLTREDPDNPLNDMSGIQFFFDTEVRFWRGHTQYMDSEWGLTSISQPQFWFKARDPANNYRSVLSVDIGIWDQPTRPELGAPDPSSRRGQRKFAKGAQPLKAWQCKSADVLAREVWAQIEDHHDEAFVAAYGKGARFPYPRFFALDQAVDIAAETNRYPFLVNVVGQFPKRPGELAGSGAKAAPKYAVCDNIVMAGTHMQTYTRITSMEAANESGRHAVNAILEHANAACDRCEIWDPEDLELPDLQWLRDLDEELFTKGLPHFVKILDWRELPGSLPMHVLKSVVDRGVRA